MLRCWQWICTRIRARQRAELLATAFAPKTFDGKSLRAFRVREQQRLLPY